MLRKLICMALSLLMLQGCVGVMAAGAITGTSIINDRRSTQTIMQDQVIRQQTYVAAQSNPEIAKRSHFNVTSFNRIILLTGQVPNAESRNQVIEQVKQVENIKRIYNELEIAPPSSTLTRSNDLWISTKIRAQLLIAKNVHSAQISILTENSTAYLLGLVTPAEGQAAADVARKIPGVKRVVTLFEHLSVVD